MIKKRLRYSALILGYCLAVFVISRILYYSLKFIPFPEGIDWPLSLAWGFSIFVGPFYFARKDKLKFRAVLACFVAWAIGYVQHLPGGGFNHLSAVFLYAGVSCICYVCFKQTYMGIIGGAMVVFGAIMYKYTGQFITTDGHAWWRTGWDVFTGLMLMPPVIQLIGHYNDPKAEVDDSPQYEFKEAA